MLLEKRHGSVGREDGVGLVELDGPRVLLDRLHVLARPEELVALKHTAVAAGVVWICATTAGVVWILLLFVYVIHKPLLINVAHFM